MLKKILALLLTTTLAPSVWAVSYNQNLTAIFGSGNPDTGWTTDTGSGITLALRAKDRFTADTSNVLGVYSFAGAPPTRGQWNYEFSINSGTPFLSNYDYYLAVDGDPSAAISYTTVTPLSYWIDNEYGTLGTANGDGVPGTIALAGSNTIAQNSQNITFGDYPGGAQALAANATYNYELFAVAKGAGANGARLADVGITVIVGNVPDSGATAGMLGFGLLGIVALRKRTLLA